ncbi:MAG: sulfite exporter TauE/SafE family protein [Firmicutes bacterium]|nr:sulfite exporter TauE/SafE family protein [Bacillota bacterium]
MTKKRKIKEITLAGLGGLGIGLANGIFGGGGGMLCVPLLEKGLRENTKTAHATAILIILPITVVSAIVYIANGYFVWQATWITSLAVVVGGIFGALLLKVLPEKLVGLVFAVIMIIAGIKMATG